MIIANNIPGLKISNQLKKINNKASNQIGKLSSGLRINKASDDAAGLAIREKMRAQIHGLDMADRNVQDGISLVQTADGALSELQNIVQRQRELSVEAANGTLTTEDRSMIQLEINELNKGINEIANNTNFNEVPLLNVTDYVSSSNTTGVGNPLALSVSNDGTFSFRTDKGFRPDSLDDNQILDFGSGSTSHPQVNIDGTSYVLRSGQNGVTVTPTIFDGTTYKTVYNIDQIEVTQSIEIVGTNKNMYEIKYDVKNNDSINKQIGILFNVDTMLGDDDYAPFNVNGTTVSNETQYTVIPSEFTVYNNKGNPFLQAKGILTGTFDGVAITTPPDKFGVGNWSRVDEWNWAPSGAVGDSGYSLWWNPVSVASGANISVNTLFGVSDPTAAEIGTINEGLNLQVGANEGQEFLITRKSVTSENLGVNNLLVDPQEEAIRSISKADKAINILSQERSKYGAYQNVLEHISANVSNYSENLTAAESRISDADIAKEVLENSQLSILQQTAQAMMSQANTMPNKVLSLLQQ